MKFRGYTSFREWWENLGGYKQCLHKYRYHDIEHVYRESVVTGYIGNSEDRCRREGCGYREITPYGYQQIGFERMTPPDMIWQWYAGPDGIHTGGWRLVPR